MFHFFQIITCVSYHMKWNFPIDKLPPPPPLFPARQRDMQGCCIGAAKVKRRGLEFLTCVKTSVEIYIPPFASMKGQRSRYRLLKVEQVYYNVLIHMSGLGLYRREAERRLIHFGLKWVLSKRQHCLSIESLGEQHTYCGLIVILAGFFFYGRLYI